MFRKIFATLFLALGLLFGIAKGEGPYQSFRITSGTYELTSGSTGIPVTCVNEGLPQPPSKYLFTTASDNIKITRVVNGKPEQPASLPDVLKMKDGERWLDVEANGDYQSVGFKVLRQEPNISYILSVENGEIAVISDSANRVIEDINSLKPFRDEIGKLDLYEDTLRKLKGNNDRTVRDLHFNKQLYQWQLQGSKRYTSFKSVEEVFPKTIRPLYKSIDNNALLKYLTIINGKALTESQLSKVSRLIRDAKYEPGFLKTLEEINSLKVSCKWISPSYFDFVLLNSYSKTQDIKLAAKELGLGEEFDKLRKLYDEYENIIASAPKGGMLVTQSRRRINDSLIYRQNLAQAFQNGFKSIPDNFIAVQDSTEKSNLISLYVGLPANSRLMAILQESGAIKSFAHSNSLDQFALLSRDEKGVLVRTTQGSRVINDPNNLSDDDKIFLRNKNFIHEGIIDSSYIPLVEKANGAFTFSFRGFINSRNSSEEIVPIFVVSRNRAEMTKIWELKTAAETTSAMNSVTRIELNFKDSIATTSEELYKKIETIKAAGKRPLIIHHNSDGKILLSDGSLWADDLYGEDLLACNTFNIDGQRVVSTQKIELNSVVDALIRCKGEFGQRAVPFYQYFDRFTTYFNQSRQTKKLKRYLYATVGIGSLIGAVALRIIVGKEDSIKNESFAFYRKKKKERSK
jgi:hypothetical protein